MLAKINWTFFVKEPDFAETMKNLIDAIRSELKSVAEKAANENADGAEDDLEGNIKNEINISNCKYN